jgi:hypothetical protein
VIRPSGQLEDELGDGQSRLARDLDGQQLSGQDGIAAHRGLDASHGGPDPL